MCFQLIISRQLWSQANSQQSLSIINSKIRSFVKQGLYTQALLLYTQKPDSTTKFTFPSLLKSCTSLSHGKTLHSTIITMGFQFDPFIAASMINLYVKCGSLDGAVKVFDGMSVRMDVLGCDVTIWNCMIDGYFRYARVREGMIEFRKMQVLGVRPDAYSLSILLGLFSSCDGLLSCVEGKQVHGYIVRNLFDGDPFLETALIGMYSSCGGVMQAWFVFERLDEKRNSVLWNSMIGGFCDNGLWQKSLELFLKMKNEGECEIVSASFTGVLTACCKGEDVSFGSQVHCDVIKMGFDSDPYVCTSLLTLYAKSKLIEDAKMVFDHIADKKKELWNAMIAAYVGNGYAYDAIETYSCMRLYGVCSDSFTISNILSSCSMIDESCDFGRIVHGELIKRPLQINIAVQSALLTMYSKLGSTDDAFLIFKTMEKRDLVAWGSMISGFCQNNKFEEAFNLFKAMEDNGVVPDSDIMASVIISCMGLEDLQLGRGIHGVVIKIGFDSDVFVATSLIDMYSKCGYPELAGIVFSSMPRKNLVAWNSIISCYCRNGLPEHSITLFSRLVYHGFYPDSVSITCVLDAVSSVATLLKGKTVHGYQIRLEIPIDLQVMNGLIDMYIKCGNLNYAQNIFQTMSEKNLVTWNSMIDGYGSHGECLKAIDVLHEMKLYGTSPDRVSFLSLISSCSHSGYVEKGISLFNSMKEVYEIEPQMEHYVNMVDLLGRAGRVNDAYTFIKNMPIEPDRSIWLCLLAACRVHRNIELGEVAASNLSKMQETTKSSNYVQLLNMYGDAELWNRAAELRGTMKEKGIKKNPGCSWIETGSKTEVFFSGDSSVSSTVEIYKTLNGIRRTMQFNEDFQERVEEVF